MYTAGAAQQSKSGEPYGEGIPVYEADMKAGQDTWRGSEKVVLLKAKMNKIIIVSPKKENRATFELRLCLIMHDFLFFIEYKI